MRIGINSVFIQYLTKTGSIHVLGSGRLLPQAAYTGGIERIDPDFYITGRPSDEKVF